MQSAVEADLQQLQWLLAIRRRLDGAIDTSEIGKEISARVREELDYRREAKHVALYRAMLDGTDIVRVPRAWSELSTGRLLTLDWLEGTRMLAHRNDPLAVRNVLATAMFTAWWYPFSRYGVIHGDPHLGNYTVFDARAEGRPRKNVSEPAGINLLDYGCIRIFPPQFVRGVVDLYHGLLHDDHDLVVSAYETWGFRRLSRELIDTLNIWARFIYAHHRGWCGARRIWPARSLPRASGAQAERPGDGAARIRVHGSRRHRARRGVSAFAR
jgi:predicted unusual protein kinase regulating ubiquinone biosynthesis (AarF/ABC1/UbiB family)